MHSSFLVGETDSTPLPLTDTKKSDIQSLAGSMQRDLQTLSYLLGQDGVCAVVADSVMRLTESKLAQLGTLLGVATESARVLEERHGAIRQANERVRDLEALIGQAQPIEGIQPALKMLGDRLYRWWELEGFGHVSDIQFGQHVLRVVLSCQMLGGRIHFTTPEPVSREELRQLWFADLRARGFRLLDEDGEKGVADCQESRDALRALVAHRLGRSRITQFTSREGRASSQLISLEVCIYDLAVINALPVPPQDSADV